MQVDQLARIEKRLIRVEKMLNDVIGKVPPERSKRITEKDAIQEYNVSKHVLRRLRMGYKRSDGLEIKPVIFKWGHRHNRNFDYDREELDQVFTRTLM